MEVEAKFAIPDEQVFQQLLKVSSLSGFQLGDALAIKSSDRYLDTASRSLLSSGYACRLRLTDDHHLVSVKGLGSVSGSIHQRAEYEVELPDILPPQDWPPGPARDLVLSICNGDALLPLFDIEQTRHKRALLAQGSEIAELSLDRVRVIEQDREAATYLELEVELLPDGNLSDLERLAAELQEGWQLAPQGRSKFERALVLVGSRIHRDTKPGDGKEKHLEPHERALVEQLARGQKVIARRARLLLAWDEGLSRSEMLAHCGLSARRARFWLGAFRQRRLGIFPPQVIEDLETEAISPSHSDISEDAPAQAGVTMSKEQGSVPGPSDLLVKPGIGPDDTMSEAGRKILAFHFRRMLYHEPGTRLGEDIEALHDMRVATRRLRAAFRVFGEFYDPAITAPFLKGLKRTGHTLGDVRDLDVFREKILNYRSTLPESQRASLDGLLNVLEVQRQAARERMVAYLDGKKYRRFTEAFGAFVETEGMGSLPVHFDTDEPRPYRVRHVAPVAIYGRLAVVRTFGDWVDVPHPLLPQLHALRIACKKLRYTLEFFAEVLAPDTKAIIKQVVTVQDHLGTLQDAVVASGILRDFLVWGTWGHREANIRQPDLETPVVAPGVVAYLAAKQAEIQRLLDTFPQIWKNMVKADFSRAVARAVAVL